MSVQPSLSERYNVKCPLCREPLSYAAQAHCPECETTFLLDGPHPVIEEQSHPHMGKGIQALQPVKVLHADGSRTSMTLTWEL